MTPKGWKLVPTEPQVEMLAAWYRTKNGHHFHDEPPPTDTSDFAAYRAMLAASPPPPVEVSDQMRSVADFVKHLDRLAAKNEAIFNAAIEEYRARYQAEHAALSAIGAKDA